MTSKMTLVSAWVGIEWAGDGGRMGNERIPVRKSLSIDY